MKGLSVNSVKPSPFALLKLPKVRLSTEIKSGGFPIEIIMDRWPYARVSISRQVMLFIRPSLAMVTSGELLQAPIIVQNVE